MKRLVGPIAFVLGIVLGLSGCGPKSAPQAPATAGPAKASAPAPASASADAEAAAAPRSFKKVIGPAVAGMFYPRHEQELTKQVDEFLAEAKPEPVKNLRALVCPHAGYPYSGKIAATGYKLLTGLEFKTVIVMAPSHYAEFEGGALPDADACETPLGQIPVSPKAAQLAKTKPFAVDPPARVQRPEWWKGSPQRLPPFGQDTPHTWEHSLEVQLPMLQRTLKEFDVVPIIFGQVADTEAAARAIIPLLDDQTLVVASSDLSHYLPYDVARKLDATSTRAIADMNLDWAEQIHDDWPGQQRPCGMTPILTLMHIAQQKGWKAKLLDYRNSGDTTGDKSRGVVGYASIAFYQAEPSAARADAEAIEPTSFTPVQRKVLLELARKTISAVVSGQDPPPASLPDIDKAFTRPRACFVTLTKGGQLRGCIGSILPQEPLYEAVIRRAQSAALEDHRFQPVTADEVKQLDIEVSVLTRPKRLEFKSPEELLHKLRPNVDGVVLRVGRNSATYLPQVWEQIPNKEKFLSQLSEKAGLSATAWRSPDASVHVYQVEAFKEEKR